MHEGREPSDDDVSWPDVSSDPAARLEDALRVVRRALDEGGGTALALAPAAPPGGELVHQKSGSRATVCVVGSDVFFLRRALPGAPASSTFRTGWFRVSLPTQDLRCRR